MEHLRQKIVYRIDQLFKISTTSNGATVGPVLKDTLNCIHLYIMDISLGPEKY